MSAASTLRARHYTMVTSSATTPPRPPPIVTPTLWRVVDRVRKITAMLRYCRMIWKQWKVLGNEKEIAKWKRGITLHKHALVMWKRLLRNRHCEHTRLGCECHLYSRVSPASSM